MLPPLLQSDIEAALAARTSDHAAVIETASVGGGCISNATRLETSDGQRYFIKWGKFAPGLFACEAHGLQELAEAGAVRVPAVIALNDQAGNDLNWLLLEWLEPGSMSGPAWQSLGRALARMHGRQRDGFGWRERNFIGALPQANEWSSDWPTFWRDARIVPQLDLATSKRGLQAQQRRRIENVLAHADEIAAAGNEDGASLLHGDLWAGNLHALAAGGAALIDPSVYYGHREVDLAMAALFGGFSREFYAAYEEAWPLLPGSDERRLLYQLYYLLVHVNLFGGSYVASTMSLVTQLGF